MKLNKILSGVGVLALTFSLFSTSAFASTTGTQTAKVGVEGGVLSITSPATDSDFGVVQMNDGFEKIVKTDLDGVKVTDARQTGEGWKVNVSASQFTEVGGAGYTLPLNSLTLEAVSSVTPDGTLSPVPSIIAGQKILDNGSSSDILSAAVNEGMGNYDVAFAVDALTLTLKPATTFVDSANYPGVPTPYESTLTLNVVTGP